ncbi:MAG: hypothetical protein EKK54_04425 [Neisseriaceae bacterium]|nr:MAG: hypothetical protein EKK54_04425 [Neisseriaceae bacterium]
MIKDQLIYAINNKHCIKFIYDGHARIVEPYCVGLHVSTKNPCFRGLQIDGSSSSKSKSDLPFWDLYLLDKISDFELLDLQFDGSNGLNKGYKRNDKHIYPIFAQI